MVKLYQYLNKHKWLLYSLLIMTTIIFVIFGSRCHFEENIAKLLPISDKDLTIDLAFSDLKVKDKLFIQVIGNEKIEAMDLFMDELLTNDEENLISGSLYTLDPTEYIDAAYYLVDNAPKYLDFTDEEMDSLTSEEHIQEQISQYLEFLETETGQNLYDFMCYDPCGIAINKFHSLPLLNQETKGIGYENNHLIAGNACIGFISPNLSCMDSKSANKLMKSIRKAIKEVKNEYPDIEILYHGSAVQSANNSARIKKDLLLTLGISLTIILLILAWCFKQFRSMILLILPICYGTILALAGLFNIKGGMSLMALGIGAIVLGVALSYCLHVLIHFIYTGDVQRTIKEQSKPVFLGSLTTIGAFAALLLTQSSLLKDFGLFALLTMVGTTIGCLIFMPHFFPKTNKRNEKAFNFLEKINTYRLDQNKWILGGMVILIAVICPFADSHNFDNNLKHINYTAPEVIYAQQQWSKNMNGGNQQQYYAAVGNTLDEALSYLTNIETKCDSLKQQNIIEKYSKISVLMPSSKLQEDRINHWKSYFSSEKAKIIYHRIAKVCRNLDLDESMFEPFYNSLNKEYDNSNIYEAGILPEEILSNFIEVVNDKYLVFIPIVLKAGNEEELKNILTKVEGCMVLDPFYYTADLVELIHNDFNKISLISSIFVLLVLLVSFRKILLAIIAFMPMCLSWFVVLGAMAITGQEFNLINIVVSSFIFGIGVDYSIFIMDGLLAEAKGEDNHLLAFHKTAITISATILIVCMASLLFAIHPSIKSIGFAAIVGMITTMMLSYTIQPYLFHFIMKNPWLREKILK